MYHIRKNCEPQILYEDASILVCRKASGIPVQTKSLGQQDMVSMLKNYIAAGSRGKGEPYLAVIHRLDQPVEGVLVFAKTPQAAKELNRQLQNGGFGKYYRAVLCGELNPPEGTRTDFLVKDGRTNMSRVCEKGEKDAKEARLSYRTIDSRGGYTLAEVVLDTGRHHQIRVQMSGLGCPIAGDVKYGGERLSAGEIALCAWRLEFVHPKTKKTLIFEIEPEGKGFQRFA